MYSASSMCVCVMGQIIAYIAKVQLNTVWSNKCRRENLRPGRKSGWSSCLDKVLRKGLSDKVRLEHRCKAREREIHLWIFGGVAGAGCGREHSPEMTAIARKPAC